MARRHALVLLLTVPSCLLGLMGCKQQAPETPAAAPPAGATKTAGTAALLVQPKDVIIGFLVKQAEEPWFQDEWRFAQQCADKYGFRLEKIAAPDPEKVLTAIDTLGTLGAQGFVICTPDVKLGPSIVDAAKKHGMKVFSVDDQFVGPDGEFMDVPYMGISAANIGKQVGEAIYKEFRNRDWPVEDTACCVVTYEQLDTSRERTDGAIEALTAAGFPADRVYKTAERTTDVPGATEAADTLLTQHPEAKHWLIASMNDEGVLGAVRAMEQRGFTADDVIGVGIGGTTAIAEFQGEKPTGFFATALIDPYRHGYETAEMMFKWITEGREPAKTTLTEGIIVTKETCEDTMRERGLLD